MILGAWFHRAGLERIEDSGFERAREAGLTSARTYSYQHSKEISKELKRCGMSLYAGVHVDAQRLIEDWRSQLDRESILMTHELGVPVVAICLGNELREYGRGGLPNWSFSGRLAFGLSRLIECAKALLRDGGFNTPVTYAMEGFGLGPNGKLLEWVVPVVEEVDVFSTNCYPMEAEDWFTLEAFERNRRFLKDRREANLRFARFEYKLCCLLEELERYDKPLILSETGLHAGVGFVSANEAEGTKMAIKTRGGDEIVPLQDPKALRGCTWSS